MTTAGAPENPDNLFDAITRCDLGALDDLLSAGADPDEIDLHGHQSTPLAWACAHGDEGAVRALLAAGARPDTAASAPPLVEATTHGFVDLVVLLLEAGADVDDADDSGATALWVAAASGFADIARKLVEAGADRTLADLDGVTPADAARAAEHVQLAAWLDDPASVPARSPLWREGRDAARATAEARRLQVIDAAMGTPAAAAEPEWTFSGGIAKSAWVTQDFPSVAASGNVALVTRMLDAGLAPDWTMADGGATALMLAARSGERETVDLLLARGADANHRNAQGLTALHMTLFKPSARLHGPVVASLLAAGADPDAVDGEGQRPLQRAFVHGMVEIATALIDAGADPFRADRAGRTPADWIPIEGRKAAAFRTLLDAARAAR